MLVKVRLLKGFPKPLFYKITKPINIISINQLINVPIKNNIVPAVIIQIYETPPTELNFTVREIESIEEFPKDSKHKSLIETIAKIYFIDSYNLYQRIRQFLNSKPPKKIDPIKIEKINTVILTDEQKAVINGLLPKIIKASYSPVLLHGVTGSGKTEIYIKLMQKAISEGKTSIFLVPEVSLAIYFEKLLKKRMSNTSIFGFHSASKEANKKNLWQKLIEAKPIIIIGVHLPVLLPISNLGLIIVDEEHETGYQEKKHPKLNSKEIAILRASIYKIPIILGSATPSLSSLYNVKKRGWDLYQLKNRFSGRFPKIEVVTIKKGKRSSFWITRPLELAIKEALEKKEQVLIFLNRRGHSFFVMCKECDFVFECPHCSVSLTLHQNDVLKCHYCTYSTSLKDCPSCKTSNLIKKGIGTQQVVGILEKMFPSARIKRADLDTSKQWQETVSLCQKGEIDIIVGTQTITKGYHLPKVTLVGVIWADMSLHFPIYNAVEITMQQLIQVAGRAGRESESSKVVLQVMNDNPVFKYLDEQKYIQFYNNEIKFRSTLNYPPSCRLTLIEIKNTDAKMLDEEVEEIFKKIEKESNKLGLTAMGPIKPSVYKIQRQEVRQIYIKSRSFNKTASVINAVNFKRFKSSIFIVPST